MSGGVTTNYGLKKPNFNVRPWDSDINSNFDLIDAILYTLTQIPNIGGVWKNSTQYTVGQNVLDGVSLTFYQCLVSNVSAASGTFAADRIANPANWTVTSSGQGVVRYDQGQVLTSGQQAQAKTNIGAIDLTAPILRYDAAQTLTYNQILQVLNNLLIDGTESSLVASSATDIGNAGSQNVVITGNATIVSFGNRPNKYKLLRFATTATLTNSSSLVLPGGANITTQAGDTAIATSDASGNWYIRAYQRADGTALTTTQNVLSYGSAQTLTNAQSVQALSNLLLLTNAITLTQAQQDFFRLNTVGAIVPTSPSANTTLVAADLDRPILATGTATLTMPNIGAGWRTGPIKNNNTVAGLTTLAVPAGSSLDGTLNGTTILFPFQRARIVQLDATNYFTDWIDRSPLIGVVAPASAVASADISLPVGYTKFRISITGINLGTAGALLGIQFGDAGGVKAGATDYSSLALSNAAASTLTNGAYGQVCRGVAGGAATFKPNATLLVFPGATGQYPNALVSGYRFDNTPSRIIEEIGVDYTGAVTGAMGRANLLRFIVSTGTGQFNATVYGEP